MIINENHIKKIIAESLRSVLLELNIGVIGRSGPIKEADMIIPSEKFAKEYALSKQIYEKHKENPKYRVNIEKVFGDTEAYRIYMNYYNAMMSKEGKKAVGFMNWLHFVCDGKKGQPIMGYEVDGSYLFGLWIDGYFLCAYFAPNGKMGMFKVISGIAQYNNIIFAVTQDMSSMLERLGIPKAETTHDAPWRGNVVTKDVFGTSQEAIKKGFEILDRSSEFENMKKQVNKNVDKDTLKTLISQYKSMNDNQKAQFKQKLIDVLQQSRPDLADKLKNNGTRV